MKKEDIQTPEDALGYYLETQLATLEWFASQSNKSLPEYRRHIIIADSLHKLCKKFKVDLTQNRRTKELGTAVRFAQKVELATTGKITPNLEQLTNPK